MNSVKLTWLGHSCFKMEYRGWSLVVDPYADGSVPGLPPLRESAAAVYCSHGHGDHNAADCVQCSSAPAPEDFSVETIESVHDHHRGARRGRNTIHVFRFGKLRIVHMGDVGCMPEEETISRLRGCDVLLLPVGGYYTVDEAEAFRITESIAPRCTVPMHYRGKGFGYDVIGTVIPFAARFDSPKWLNGADFEVNDRRGAGLLIPQLGR